MAKVKIKGVEYELRMSLWASEQVEKKYGGDLRKAMEDFKKHRTVTMIKEYFQILANAGRKQAGKPMDVPLDVLDDCTVADMSLITNALREAMDETMHAETVGGNEADDEVADAYAAELEQKEKNG